jgi:hypothetical protein
VIFFWVVGVVDEDVDVGVIYMVEINHEKWLQMAELKFDINFMCLIYLL